MRSESYRKIHLQKVWQGFQDQSLPLDLFLNYYFRSNHSLGSKDRKWIGDLIYKATRWKGLIDHVAPKEAKIDEWLNIARSLKPQDFLTTDTLPLHVRLSIPKFFFTLLQQQFGNEVALNISKTSNQNAPVTGRVNTLKISRCELLKSLSTRFEVHPTAFSPYGFFFTKRIPLQTTAEFQEGLFEIQDEGSQLMAELIDAGPGDHVLDYCAGAGGKTLAFAHKMKGKGQIYLYDIRKHALQRAKVRLKRAGVQNAQPFQEGKKQQMDWILVDAPCSGTGTYRRNPDLKWKLTKKNLDELIALQKKIVQSALPFLKPGGKLVYVTCSLLREENEEQIMRFIKNLPLELQGLPFRTHPIPGGMDGFFGAVMNKSSRV